MAKAAVEEREPSAAQMISALAVLEMQLEGEMLGRRVAPTEEQEEILAECERDFGAFLPYWTFLSRETRELETLGNLWDGQRDFVAKMKEAGWLYALKAGKLGFTELETAFDGWVARFKKNSRVHVFSMGATEAEELLAYVKFGLMHLPDWMRLPVDTGRGADIDRSLRLSAGPDDVRTIVRYAAGANVSIDQTATHSHVDELARMPYPEQTWAAVKTTISPVDGTCHIVTRGAGPANYSADLWHNAMEGGSRLVPFFSPWTKRPREAGWYEEEKAGSTPMALREFCPETWEDAIGGPGMDAVVPLDWIEEAMRR